MKPAGKKDQESNPAPTRATDSVEQKESKSLPHGNDGHTPQLSNQSKKTKAHKGGWLHQIDKPVLL